MEEAFFCRSKLNNVIENTAVDYVFIELSFWN